MRLVVAGGEGAIVIETFEVVLDMGLSSGGSVVTHSDVCWDLDFEDGNEYNSGWNADAC